MKMQTGLGFERRRGSRAFTLVELMVVITIIAVLIGLLVPAVAKVRQIAMGTSTKSTVAALDLGLEAYRGDGKLGGVYPPSNSDMIKQSVSKVWSPYTNLEIPISGAGLMVWALSGADRLGTPGFRATGGRTQWGVCTGTMFKTVDNCDLYAVYPPNDPTNPGQPVCPRYGPYIDQSKVKMTTNAMGLGEADFTSDAERRGREATGRAAVARGYPVFLDAFGYPILYWRADPAGSRLADPDATSPGQFRGRYHWGDNATLVANSVDGTGGGAGTVSCAEDPTLVLSSAGNQHRMKFPPGNYTPQSLPPADSFQAYIRDTGVQASLAPQRAESYLLVSPGPDGLYGTADDIANFSHNGR